jgi:hypothetical protein
VLRFIFRSVVVAGVLILVLGCTSVRVDEEVIFVPRASITPGDFDIADLTLRELTVPASDGTPIDAWYMTRPDARATVLFFGGNGFYLVQSRGYVESFARHPVNILMWDYPGYGKTPGEPDVEAIKSDGLDVYDYARANLGIAPGDLILHGHSVGSFMATYTASEREAGALVLENPATNAEDWLRTVVPWFLRLFVSFEIAESIEDEDSLARLRELSLPTAIFAGEADFITPPVMAERLRDASAAEDLYFHIFSEAGHNGLYSFDAYHQTYTELIELIGG